MTAAHADMLRNIGGDGKLYQREWRIRVKLNWHTKPASTIRHMLFCERRLTVEEAKQVEAAHLRHCAERIGANRADSERLFDAMRQAIAAMEASDAEFYRPYIEAVRDALLPPGDKGGPARGED